MNHTINIGIDVGNYYVYYYIPAGNNYKAKSGRVSASINALIFAINYENHLILHIISKGFKPVFIFLNSLQVLFICSINC